MKFKKGQGLSLNVIIIAAIALIVLIVLVFILTGRMGKFGEDLESCFLKTGHDCSVTACDSATQVDVLGTKCEGTTKPYCCMNVAK